MMELMVLNRKTGTFSCGCCSIILVLSLFIKFALYWAVLCLFARHKANNVVYVRVSHDSRVLFNLFLRLFSGFFFSPTIRDTFIRAQIISRIIHVRASVFHIDFVWLHIDLFCEFVCVICTSQHSSFASSTSDKMLANKFPKKWMNNDDDNTFTKLTFNFDAIIIFGMFIGSSFCCCSCCYFFFVSFISFRDARRSSFLLIVYLASTKTIMYISKNERMWHWNNVKQLNLFQAFCDRRAHHIYLNFFIIISVCVYVFFFSSMAASSFSCKNECQIGDVYRVIYISVWSFRWRCSFVFFVFFLVNIILLLDSTSDTDKIFNV